VRFRRWLPGSGESPNYEYAIPLLRNTPKAAGLRKRDRERPEALRSAGGPNPSLRERAVALVQERGIVRTRELTDIGVPRCYLTRMCEEGLLIKVGYGRYKVARCKVA
jgi:Transcriptional regulator, AbiEi antitoxin